MAVRCESTHHVAEMSTVALGTHTDVGGDAIFSALLIYDQIKKVSRQPALFFLIDFCIVVFDKHLR